MVATSEILSAIVRDFGCVAIWRRIAESGVVLRRDRDVESVVDLPLLGVRTLSGVRPESGIIPSETWLESRAESRGVAP